jgi:hypothetical protein
MPYYQSKRVQSQYNKPKRALDHKEKNQNWINIYVLPFKEMAIRD